MYHEQEWESQELIPTVQDTIIFHGKPIIVIRLPDGRPGVVLRGICENLQLGTAAQVERIKRTEVISDDLVYVQVETEGGFQKMVALVLHAIPFWLAGINPSRTSPEMRPIILAYQREVVDVLYAWASTPKATTAPTDLVPSEPIAKPERPAQDASLPDWREYYLRMAAFLEWQMDIETWRGSVESRLEGLEAITDLIPDILDRLGPETLSTEHQRSVQGLVKRLHDATGKPFGTIYDELKAAFDVPRYQEIREQSWDKVLNWFTVQINRAKGKLSQ